MSTSAKRNRFWSDKARLLLMLELAVVLPAAALVFVSVLHVKHIQRDRQIEAAIQRDFSQVLAISEKQFAHRAYELADDVRNSFPGVTNVCSGNLDKALASHPYVTHVFFYDPQHGLIFRSQPYRMSDPDVRAEASSYSKMYEGWLSIEFESFHDKMSKMAHKGTAYYVESEYPTRGDKHVYQPAFLFAGKDEVNGKKFIGGIILDPEYMRDKFFPETLEKVMNHNMSEAQSSTEHAVMMIHPKNDSTPIVTSAGWDGGTAEVERNMESVFPGIMLAIKLRGTTLAAIGERFAHTSLLTLGALSLMLAAGLFWTYRNVSKEMAVARLKSDFVSNVSHELRTPLSLIRLYAETLEMGRISGPEKSQEYYTIIRKESERLSALINNILDFSRIEAGRKEYDFRETDVAELVKNTLESYRYQIEQNGFTFEENIREVPPLKVDREAIARSVLNLVNNSLKYSQDRKHIAVNLYPDSGAVKLEVSDHGIGIPSEEQNKIFEKFYRVGDPLVHNTKGSGLGLSLVRHIVEAHGGQVTVDSAPGRGSVFTISLPINQQLTANPA
ncbi:MAG: sensor histidine kinase [Acidobacteria bacterium]|nr:MAG: sensor histidine kinase [Acidobacteriota bacterium]